MGIQIRDVNDEFKGAAFRDEKTKLMFAYDYENRHVIRIWGYNIKPTLYEEMKRLGVDIHNRMATTSLLTEGGKQGARVVGATAVDARTGEFYVFRAKATIIATGGAGRLALFAPEITASSSMSDMNSAGVGQAIGWNAGAEFVCMEASGHNRLSGFGYAPYSMGGTSNTYHGTPIVDADGKEVPWMDTFGRELQTVDDSVPARGRAEIHAGHRDRDSNYLREYNQNDLTRDLVERIRKGEFKLPLYADLTRLPESERWAIFGMMVGNEGKTRIPIYDTILKPASTPIKTCSRRPVMPPEGYAHSNFWGARHQYPAERPQHGGRRLSAGLEPEDQPGRALCRRRRHHLRRGLPRRVAYHRQIRREARRRVCPHRPGAGRRPPSNRGGEGTRLYRRSSKAKKATAGRKSTWPSPGLCGTTAARTRTS